MSYSPEGGLYGPHYSVLREECLEWLQEGASDPARKFLFADLTFGGGGHALALAEKSENYHLICTDQDPDALKNGRDLIQSRGLTHRVHLEDTNFRHFPDVLAQRHSRLFEECGGLHGVLMDLGVSSHHFDSPERGFSFRFEGPLDMRMDADDAELPTAADIVNSYREEELERIFREYGEEKFAARIARAIVEKRKTKRLETTLELEDLAFHCYPKALRHGRIGPATRIFQALRIEVNSELEVVTDVLPRLMPLLAPGGKILVISFHSLEDRIVKNVFRDWARERSDLELVTKRPIVPGEKEIRHNSRSRSAKLRIIRRAESTSDQGVVDGHKKKKRFRPNGT